MKKYTIMVKVEILQPETPEECLGIKGPCTNCIYKNSDDSGMCLELSC